jgi:phospholipid-binding lipoprotein MlaA
MRSRIALVLLFGALGTACATAASPSGEPAAAAERHDGSLEAGIEAEDDWLLGDEFDDPAQRDPAEGMNRAMFGFNELLRKCVFDPIARGYRFVMPEPGRRAVFRFFANLGEPIIFLNDVLQLAPRHAGNSGARFLVNSTVGLAGFFDPASTWGLERKDTDFGQTLAVYSVRSGPYVVLPALGPSTARDAVGSAFDLLLRPDLWLFGVGTVVVVGTGTGLVTYEVERERLQALRETSVDFYAALRGAYLLDRDAAVEARIHSVRPESSR